MKKGLFIQSMLTVAFALFLANGAFGQVVVSNSGQFDTGTDVTGTTLQMTTGKSYPVYVTPDSYYHPSWDPTDATTITAGFTWTWAVTGDVALDAGDANNDPYMVVTATGAAGTTGTVSVHENLPAGWGSCSGADNTFNVSIVATPTISVDNSGTEEACVGDITATAFTITPSGIGANWVAYSVEIATLEEDNTTVVDRYQTDKTTTTAGNAVEYTTAAGGSASIAEGANVNPWLAPTIIDNKTTRYTYTVTAVNDQISRRGDFAGMADGDAAGADETDFMWYDVAGVNGGGATHELVIIVHPKPVTGPIYYINSGWAN